MKKDNNTIKRLLKYTNVKDLHGYFKQDDNYILCNSISVIKFDSNNIDFLNDIEPSQSIHYSYNKFNNMFKDVLKTIQDNNNTIKIDIQDLKMWKKHADKNKPFVFKIGDKYASVNAAYLLDLALLTRQDKNKLIKIKVLDKKAPLYIDGNGVKAILCPIVLNKTDFNKDDYIAFLNKLSDCYDLEKALQDEKQLKKTNAPKRNKKTKVSNMPIIVNDGVVCKDGYIYSDKNVDFFIYKNADNKTYTLYHLNSMLPCFTDCKSITAAIELIYNKLGEKSFIEKVIDIMQGNGAQERYNILIKAIGCLESATHFIDKLKDFKPTPTPDNDNDTTETKTSDIVKADTVKADTCTDTDKAATTDTANNDNITATQDIKTTETMQADTRQTETTQDTTPTHTATKTATSNNKSVSLFIVKDKPEPVKLPTLKQLERIPTFVERFKTDFKPLKNNKGYNTRVKELKPLKKAYNDFVGTVSCYNDKYAISGDMVAVNSS